MSGEQTEEEIRGQRTEDRGDLTEGNEVNEGGRGQKSDVRLVSVTPSLRLFGQLGDILVFVFLD